MSIIARFEGLTVGPQTKRLADGTERPAPVPRDQNVGDFYPTPERFIRCAASFFPAALRSDGTRTRVWEPTYGEGAIGEYLRKKGYEIIASDLYPRKDGVMTLDFIKQLIHPTEYDAIVMNPPFGSEAPKFLKQLCAQPKPFFSVFNLSMISGNKDKLRLFKNHGLSVIFPLNGTREMFTSQSSVTFYSIWVTRLDSDRHKLFFPECSTNAISKDSPHKYMPYRTPVDAIRYILPLIPPSVRAIWDPACNRNELVDELQSTGNYENVIGTPSVSQDKDWPLPSPPGEYDMIVSSPFRNLFSQTTLLRRLCEQEKPFMVLGDINLVTTGKRWELMKNHGLCIIPMPFRVQFTEKSNAQSENVWVARLPNHEHELLFGDDTFLN
jgi:hypothetical protein